MLRGCTSCRTRIDGCRRTRARNRQDILSVPGRRLAREPQSVRPCRQPTPTSTGADALRSREIHRQMKNRNSQVDKVRYKDKDLKGRDKSGRRPPGTSASGQKART
jgi:hypothetical protein